jgi:putative PIN family toxin of toxin-antitoxin system
MRAIVDSNVLARATYSAGGPAAEVVRKLTEPPHLLIVSPFLLAELRRVLAYPRLQRLHGFDQPEIERVVAAIAAWATSVEPKEQEIVRVVPDDPDDDHILAAAVAGKVNVICTRNKHFYHDAVIAYCNERSIEVLDDISVLTRLRENEAGTTV